MLKYYRLSWLTLTTTTMAVPALAAQATRDTPTITLSVFGGRSQARDLWHVAGQKLSAPPIFGDPSGLKRFDTVDLKRDLVTDLTFGITATKFVGANVGLSGEISHTGFKTRDQCMIVSSETQDTQNQVACAAITQTARNSSTTDFVAGLVLRPMPYQKVQLYVLAKGGVAFQSERLAALSTTTILPTPPLGELAPATIVIYPQGKQTATRFMHSVGVGVGTNLGGGYEFHLELRENWRSLATVTGASAMEGLVPPTSTISKRQATLLFGIDLVLDKRRGRRY